MPQSLLSTRTLHVLLPHLALIRADVIAAKVLDSYPWLEESGVIDTILPKKEQVMIGKW